MGYVVLFTPSPRTIYHKGFYGPWHVLYTGSVQGPCIRKYWSRWITMTVRLLAFPEGNVCSSNPHIYLVQVYWKSDRNKMLHVKCHNLWIVSPLYPPSTARVCGQNWDEVLWHSRQLCQSATPSYPRFLIKYYKHMNTYVKSLHANSKKKKNS